MTGTGGFVAERKRIDSVDLLRGLIMVIMMLDHTRDFVHHDSFVFDPTDVTKTWPLLFFTRWITHFCAPLFVFLAGTGAYFQEMRGKSKSELSRFLVTRGAWLIVVEVVIIRMVIFFNFHYGVVLAFLQVIWVIGWSMILLAAIIHLPRRVIMVGSVSVIALHNLLDGIHGTSWKGPGSPTPGFGASIWKLLHEQGVFFPFGFPGPGVLLLYPLIPWFAVMAAGYTVGAIYRLDGLERKRIFYRSGWAITIGFVVIRAINLYGDPSRWTSQPTLTKTLLSFLATSKYPPSLLYLMMTIGPALLFLGWFDDKRRGALSSILIVYGRVPLFFYVLQWLTAHTLAIVAGLIAHKPIAFLFGDFDFSPPPPANFGFGLATTYFLWLLGVTLLYFPCRWFAGVKARRRDWWLSYL